MQIQSYFHAIQMQQMFQMYRLSEYFNQYLLHTLYFFQISWDTQNV